MCDFQKYETPLSLPMVIMDFKLSDCQICSQKSVGERSVLWEDNHSFRLIEFLPRARPCAVHFTLIVSFDS